jgi:SAM-dependent methyltransferase
MGNFQHIQHHFERVALAYDHVRNTDPDVIEAIITHLPRDNRPVYVADIGCGTGRYSRLIAARLNSNVQVICCDYSAAMLAECCQCMSREFPSPHIYYCRVCANNLPLAEGCLDVVVTFNSVHHFDLNRFVAGAARILRRGGLLFIYTRTPEQNARTVWGQYLPEFTERETRLCRRTHLENAIGSVPELRLEGMQEFEHVRVESLESLLKKARNFHYSTFALYPPDEFRRALETFTKRLTNLSNNSLIEHMDENTLVLAQRI